MLPCSVLIVLEDKLFSRVLGISADRLKVLDVLRCHVGQKTEVLVQGSCRLRWVTGEHEHGQPTVAFPLKQFNPVTSLLSANQEKKSPTIDTSASSREIGPAVSVGHWRLCPSQPRVRQVWQRALHRKVFSFYCGRLLDIEGTLTVYGGTAGLVGTQLL